MNRLPVFRLVLVQTLASLLVALALFGWRDHHAALSALLGGLIIVVANAWFLWRVFGRYQRGQPALDSGADAGSADTVATRAVATKGEQSSAAVLSAYYRAEAIKFLLVMLLLTLVFTVNSAGPVNDVHSDGLEQAASVFSLNPAALFAGFFSVMFIGVVTTTLALASANTELWAKQNAGSKQHPH